MIDAADLAEDPAGTLRAYCRALEVPFIPRALEWDEGLPATWRDVSGWHADLAGSTGIIAEPAHPAAGSGGPGLDAAPHLRDYYEHHLPFHRKMRAHRLEPAAG